MLGLNKLQTKLDIAKVEELGDNWEEFIPKQPNYSIDYSSDDNETNNNSKESTSEEISSDKESADIV